MWPALFPGASGYDTTAAWFPVALQSPVLFSACMYGAALHRQNRSPDKLCVNVQKVLGSENETISRLHPLLKEPALATEDDIIFSIMTLAFRWREGLVAASPDPHPQRPLQNLQWLALYSSLPVNEAHVHGLSTLLKLKGGIEKVGLPGLAPLLS